MYVNTSHVSSLAAISKPCEAPPRVENAVVSGAYQKEYSSGSTVTYLCRQKYTMEGEGMITCTNGHWDKVDINCTCTYFQKHCTKPLTQFQLGSMLTYQNAECYYECMEEKWNFGSFPVLHSVALPF